MSPETLFSLEEANALLPQIELIMERLQRIGMALREEIAQLAQEYGQQTLARLSPQQLVRLKPSFGSLLEDLERGVQEIEQLGCSFKGLDLGLVDFPAKIGGEIVELCWQYGEKEIAFYHHRDEGFVGRRPLNPQRTKQRYYQQ